MIKYDQKTGKTIINFGYGTVCVQSNTINMSLILTSIKPPQLIGPISDESDIEYGERVTITGYKYLRELEVKLKNFDLSNDNMVEVDNCILTFIAGSYKSRDIVLKAIERIIDTHIWVSAC